MKLDLNCDLGEGEPINRTRALMQYVTSVNLACGGHAGDLASMDRCVQLAQQRGVRVGAHPGVAGNFGRGEVSITPSDLALLIVHQVGALFRLAKVHRVRLHHVKLHGALYHATETRSDLAAAYVDTLARWFHRLPIYARAGGRVVTLARRRGVPVWEEAFADRAYDDDGGLIPRGEPGALMSDLKTIRERIQRLRSGRGLVAQSGRVLVLKPRTVCVHGDGPDAVHIARLAANELGPLRPAGSSQVRLTRY